MQKIELNTFIKVGALLFQKNRWTGEFIEITSCLDVAMPSVNVLTEILVRTSL